MTKSSVNQSQPPLRQVQGILAFSDF